MKNQICSQCDWSIMSNGKCSNRRCENFPRPEGGVSLGEMDAVFSKLGFFEGRRWGRWKLRITERCLEHYRHPSQMPYQVSLDEIHDSASMLDWIFQVSCKSWTTYKDISDLISALDDIFDPQSTLCRGSMNGTEGTSIDAGEHLKNLFRGGEDDLLNDLSGGSGKL
jgi:hypothetical protein